ncbi:MAG TPA: acetate/propionate family kinase [Dehalococcoidia bacterium]|nr:acetate/propionate family kinase [Dehalococcoidia bacterium]
MNSPHAGVILVVNAGSSSLKLRVLDAHDQVVEQADLPAIAGASDLEAVRGLLARHPGIRAIGHRMVHGGPEFQTSTLITGDLLERLRAVSDLAPLHNPSALAGLDAMIEAAPGLPNVVCFDTAFHASLPAAAATYAIPRQWTEAWGIRRYGFHGLNHSYLARRVPELLERPSEGLRLVSCHLGAGASLAAILDGHSIDTTMGFTPLEGLVMATRSGSLDPGILIHVQRHHGLSVDELERVLDEESGLRGLSGSSGDMRAVERAVDEGDPLAALAFEVYVHRLAGAIAAMAASLGGVDAIAFTGGVGEGSARLRHAATARLAFLGVTIDEATNERAGDEDGVLSPEGAAVPVLLVHAREDLEIAREVRRTLAP